MPLRRFLIGLLPGCDKPPEEEEEEEPEEDEEDDEDELSEPIAF